MALTSLTPTRYRLSALAAAALLGMTSSNCMKSANLLCSVKWEAFEAHAVYDTVSVIWLSQAGDHSQVPQPAAAVDGDALETVIMQAVQASMGSVFNSLAAHVQQLDGKVSQWWASCEGTCAHLQAELEALRRSTADDVSAIAAGLALVKGCKVHVSCFFLCVFEKAMSSRPKHHPG